MKKFFLFSNIVFLLCACTPSSSAIRVSMAKTQASTAYGETQYAIQTDMATLIYRTPTPDVSQTSHLITAIVKINFTYLYAGPSPYHKRVMCGENICSLSKGAQVAILEEYEHYGEIWYFILTHPGEKGWLYSGWLLIDGDPGNIPTASFIPTYP